MMIKAIRKMFFPDTQEEVTKQVLIEELQNRVEYQKKLEEAMQEQVNQRQQYLAQQYLAQQYTDLTRNNLQQSYASQLQSGLLGTSTYTSTGVYGQGAYSLTPEGKVKDKVKKALDHLGVYYTMPVTSGYGNSGVPDILACVEGHFFGIECKAGGGKPTALQVKHLEDIVAAGGASLVIDETNVDNVAALILAKLGELK